MAKINIDQSLEDIMARNVQRFGLRKTRDGRVFANDRQYNYGGQGNRGGNNYRGRYGGVQKNRIMGRQKHYYRQGERSNSSRSRLDKIRKAQMEHQMAQNNYGLHLISYGSIARMHVSNLDFGVTQGDMKELFSTFGKLKHCALHYDKNARSQGTCELIFERKADAVRAFKQYNGVPLDGRPMVLEIMGEPIDPAEQRAQFQNYAKQRLRTEFEDLDDDMDGYRGNRGNSFNRNRGQSNYNNNNNTNNRNPRQKEQLTAEELDNELDTYLLKNKK